MTTEGVQVGQRLELDITTVAFGGDGIGRVDNFVVFVPFVIEGERVEVEIVEFKRSQIRDVFERIGKIASPPIEPVVGSPREYHYRNKIVVHGPGKPGFWTVRGRSIIGIEQCPIAREEVNAKLTEISQQPLENVHLTVRSNSAGEVWS